MVKVRENVTCFSWVNKVYIKVKVNQKKKSVSVLLFYVIMVVRDVSVTSRHVKQASLFAAVDDDSTNNLALLHFVVNLLQLGQLAHFVNRLDQSPGKELNGLDGIASGSDVRSLDLDTVQDGKEDIGFECCVCRHSDTHDTSLWSGIREGLVVREFGSRSDDGGMSTSARGLLDILDQVLGLCEVDIDFSTERHGQFLLLVTCIDGNHAETHGFCVLDSEMAETTSCSWDTDPLAWSCLGDLEGLVDCDSGTHDG